MDPELARNCTTISPCQQDATIIRNSEITQNIVNSCGRTEINGNIDVGEQTENELAANRVTQVTQGGSLAVTIHQVSCVSWSKKRVMYLRSYLGQRRWCWTIRVRPR